MQNKILSIKLSKSYYYTFIKLTILILTPILFYLLIKVTINNRGPLWLGMNSDPSYCYLFNSLLLLNNQSPYHVDHPGTTTQVLGAICLWIHKGQGSLEFYNNYILNNPELALNQIVDFIINLFTILLLIFGVLIWLETKSLYIAFVYQCTILFFGQTYYGLSLFRPEAIFPIICIPLTYFLYLLYINKGGIYIAWICGILAGMGLMNKWTFLPFIFIGLTFAGSYKKFISYIIGFITSFSILIYLIRHEITRSVLFLYGVITHAAPGGNYGSGPQRIIDVTLYIPNILFLLKSNYLFIIFILSGILITIFIFIHHGNWKALKNIYYLKYITLWILEILIILIVAAHPAYNYLTALVDLLPLNILLIFYLVKHFNITFKSKTIHYFLILICLCEGYIQYDNQNKSYIKANEGQIKSAKIFSSTLIKNKSVPIYCYGANSIQYALIFGNEYARFYFSNQLNKLYPNTWSFNIYTGTFENFYSFIPKSYFYDAANRIPLTFFGYINLQTIKSLTLPYDCKTTNVFDSEFGRIFQIYYSE